MGLQNKFADNDPYVQSQQTVTSNNNQISLNAVLAESNHLRGSSIAFSSQAINREPGTPFPNALVTGTNTIGAALGGIGQGGTASEEEGGGGNPCFIGETQITMLEGFKAIKDIELGEKVLGFDKAGKLIPQRVVGLHSHLEATYMLVEFEDGSTGSTPGHKYWTRTDYEPIANLESVWHWNNGWTIRKVTGKKIVRGEVILYNLTVANTHNYIANGDAVSNLKPHEE